MIALKMNLWNVKNLELPPRNTYKAKNQDVDISTLRAVVEEGYNTFKNDKSLKEEAALLSRTIYRLKLKLRSDKGLKAMEKTNRALLQYLRMDIPRMLETFYGMIPRKYGYNTYLPTLNMLHYVLTRIQGLAKLIVRVVECAKTAALFLEARISIGHLWTAAFICFTVVSKIFVLSKQLARFCCKFYSQLYPFTKTLQNVGMQWLPNDCVLPCDLKVWLDVDWLDQEDSILIPKPKKVKIPTIFDIIVDSDSDVEFCKEYIEIEDDDFVDEYTENTKTNENQNVQVKSLSDPPDSAVKTVLFKNDDEFMEIRVEQDLGEVVTPHNKNANSKKKKNKRKKSQNLVEETKIAKFDESVQVNQSKENVKNSKKKRNRQKKLKSEKVVHLLENITTLKDLQKLEKNFNKIQEEYPNRFRNIDKLQRSMLHSSIRKYIRKAKRCNDLTKIDSFIIKAKNTLKSSLV